MTRPDEIREMIRDAEARFGVDILVNNAGIQHVSPIVDFPEEKWDAVLAINLSAAFHTTKACLPGMTSRGFGRIINIASAHGKVASPHKSAYCASKFGILGLTKVTALETAGTGVTCNAICPGWVLTALVEQQVVINDRNDPQPELASPNKCLRSGFNCTVYSHIILTSFQFSSARSEESVKIH